MATQKAHSYTVMAQSSTEKQIHRKANIAAAQDDGSNHRMRYNKDGQEQLAYIEEMKFEAVILIYAVVFSDTVDIIHPRGCPH